MFSLEGIFWMVVATAISIGFLIVLVCMVISMVPPGDSANKLMFEVKVIVMTVVAILFGLILYWRGVRAKGIEESGR